MARRYLWCILLVISLMVSTVVVAHVAEVSSSSQPVIAMSPKENTGLLGETFTVDVTIADVTLNNSINGVYYWEFRISFNPSILNVTGVKEGGFLRKVGKTSWSMMPPNIDNNKGTVAATDVLWQYPSTGAFGSGILAKVTFQVKAAGETPLPFYFTEVWTWHNKDKIRLDHTSVDGSFLLSSIRVDPAITRNPTLRQDKNYTISIKTDDIRTDIWGWDFTLTYNPNVLHGIRVNNGDLIVNGTGGEDTGARFLPGTLNNTEGKLSVTEAFFYYSTPPPNLTSGPGTLATVTFQVVGVGTSDITLGPETRLIGANATTGQTYDIIDAATTPYRIFHGFFDNTFHDIAVTNVTASPDTVYPGESISINATVANEGDYNETFTVTVYADLDTKVIGDEITVGRQTNVNLTVGDSTLLTFNWNTGDARSGVYNVTAIASFVPREKNRANNVGWQRVIIRGAPVARFTYSPMEPVVDETVTFDASTSYDPDPDGGIVSYAWNFGDGTTEIYVKENLTATTTHAYTMADTYKVRLTVMDIENKTDTTLKSITVGKLDSNISISAFPTSVTVGESITINGSITPIRVNVTVTIWYRLTGEPLNTANVTTNEESQYSYLWTPETAGTYEVNASWPGDANTNPAQSETLTITVNAAPLNIIPYAVAAVAVIVLAAIAIYFLRVRKRT